jgi:hypothetical protein
MWGANRDKERGTSGGIPGEAFNHHMCYIPPPLARCREPIAAACHARAQNRAAGAQRRGATACTRSAALQAE